MKLSLLFFAAFALFHDAVAQSSSGLQAYFIDVEGGQATLFVTPSKQSLLIDTGWPGHEGRDADRIVAAAKSAGVSRLDYVLLTHYHDDHVGGVPQLVARMPVGTFIDHGPNRETTDAVTAHGYSAYQAVLAQGKSQHITVKPGDTLPITGMKVTVVSADGALLAKPLPGAGRPNSFCAGSDSRSADQTENARSLGIEINFGTLRILDLGDLTWDKEMELECPNDKLGAIDVLVVSHHGWQQSSSPALIDAIHPRVAIMDNGAKKGGSISVFKTLAEAPGLKALWQVHSSDEVESASTSGLHNTDPARIANLPGPDAGNYLKLTAFRDGAFELLNSRTSATVHYAAAGGAETASMLPSSTR